VNAWNSAELEQAGIPFLEHDARYAYGAEWLSVVEPLLRGEPVTHSGPHFQEPLAKLRRGSARFVASGDAASVIWRDCSGIAEYSAASERFWVTSGKPMATLPRNGGKALMSCLDANALR
jgi:hypothetical protein